MSFRMANRTPTPEGWRPLAGWARHGRVWVQARGAVAPAMESMPQRRQTGPPAGERARWGAPFRSTRIRGRAGPRRFKCRSRLRTPGRAGTPPRAAWHECQWRDQCRNPRAARQRQGNANARLAHVHLSANGAGSIDGKPSARRRLGSERRKPGGMPGRGGNRQRPSACLAKTSIGASRARRTAATRVRTSAGAAP
jgi:hypothetical protein